MLNKSKSLLEMIYETLIDIYIKFYPYLENDYIVCTLPPAFLQGRGVEFPTKFSKRGGGLAGPQLLEGGCWERGGVTSGLADCNCHIKNKLKSEIFKDKKSL